MAFPQAQLVCKLEGCWSPDQLGPPQIPDLMLLSGSNGPARRLLKPHEQACSWLGVLFVLVGAVTQTGMTHLVLAFTSGCYSLALPCLSPVPCRGVLQQPGLILLSSRFHHENRKRLPIPYFWWLFYCIMSKTYYGFYPVPLLIVIILLTPVGHNRPITWTIFSHPPLLETSSCLLWREVSNFNKSCLLTALSVWNFFYVR